MSRTVPIGRTSIILALDVSRSMCSTDVDPNRITVAQAAARAFVQDQAAGTRIGIVVFSGSAQLAVPPTTDRKALIGAIDGLTTSVGTAIGSAILKSLDAIAEVNPNVQPVGDAPTGDVGPAGANGFVPDIVVLLTDGANTRGIKPLDAVPYAIERGVRVYTIGFGTTQPAPLVCSRAQLGGAALGDGGGGGFGGGGGGGGFGGGGGGGGSPLVADEADLASSRRPDRWRALQRPGHRAAAQGVRGSSEGRRPTEEEDRDLCHLRRDRRATRGGRDRRVDPLESLPVDPNGLSAELAMKARLSANAHPQARAQV